MANDEIAKLTEDIVICEACHLKDSRTQVVPGLYGPKNGLCIIGEAPGYHEDKQGIPFVGRSGKLLDNMLSGIGLERKKDLSILNVIKCRPTTADNNNRTPTNSELKFCGERWLFKQLKLLSPKLIVTIGSIPLRFFIPSAAVTKYVGKSYDTDFGIKLFVTYHPAYILRNYNLMDVYNEHFEGIKNLYLDLLNQNEIISEKKKSVKGQGEQKSLTDFM
ncbi:MAG: uracil-DNA glycosylase [Candidatus Heimdallarchaeota archaeon]|nr:uracil-DNA glycosylase [Candidatus Heimdallarchaeota archaeon]MCG3257621.1 uracil-DNA glycosylase [Candidatus Heimdallarchaeota archaeon]MCK4612673.1 uracil-DNA glycosylase [Candidatus Heimdallarchaeota archaeon]